MQQRVAIARALAYQPSILLMDEPFASVDAQTRGDLEDLVLRLRDDYGITILFVTHDIDESVYLADRIVVLDARADGGEGDRRGGPRRAARPDRDQGATRVHDLRGHVYRLIKREQPAVRRRGTAAWRRWPMPGRPPGFRGRARR